MTFLGFSKKFQKSQEFARVFTQKLEYSRKLKNFSRSSDPRPKKSFPNNKEILGRIFLNSLETSSQRPKGRLDSQRKTLENSKYSFQLSENRRKLKNIPESTLSFSDFASQLSKWVEYSENLRKFT